MYAAAREESRLWFEESIHLFHVYKEGVAISKPSIPGEGYKYIKSKKPRYVWY